MDPAQVARLLRVSTESAYQWRFWRGRRGGPGGERPGPERVPGSGASSTGPASLSAIDAELAGRAAPAPGNPHKATAE
jgi:hypothetical protein